MSTDRASSRDLMRSGSRMITAIGPVRLPSIGEIRDTLTVLAHAGGRHTPIGLVPTTESRRWEHRPQDFLGNVQQLGPCTREDVPRLLTGLARAGASVYPLNVAVAGDFLLLDISHGLGDGRLALSLVRAVAGGRSGTPVPEWPGRETAHCRSHAPDPASRRPPPVSLSSSNPGLHRTRFLSRRGRTLGQSAHCGRRVRSVRNHRGTPSLAGSGSARGVGVVIAVCGRRAGDAQSWPEDRRQGRRPFRLPPLPSGRCDGERKFRCRSAIRTVRPR